MLEINALGLTDWSYISNGNAMMPLEQLYAMHIERPTPRRLFALAYALYKGKSIDELNKITGINKWFLMRLLEIADGLVDIKRHKNLLLTNSNKFERKCLESFKQLGFSDRQIADEIGVTEADIRIRRNRLGLKPSIFQIDTLAAEFPAKTNYLFLTYHGSHNDVAPFQENGVIVLGSGPYRIGSSVEFDWSCVSSARRLAHHRRKSIIVNSNPETVSTDYDMSDRLYFEELTLERVIDIYEFENSEGMIISVGGQTPNNLATKLDAHKVRILGTAPADIDRAEDRGRFSAVLDKLSIIQPEWKSVTALSQAYKFAKHAGYPVLIRPSYVLSGSAMKICYNDRDIELIFTKAVQVSKKFPVTVSKFVEGAKEIEFDAVSCKGKIMTYAVSEHVEQAGVHSGDATIVFPASKIYIGTQQQIIRAAQKLAKEFNITGPFNIQFLGKNSEVSIIEMNLRASRTFPLLSKAIGINFASMVVDAVYGECNTEAYAYPIHSVVKAPQFSFSRLQGADPVLDVEMTSTGEVGCFGDDREEAYLKALLSVGLQIPKKNVLLSISDAHKEDFVESARILHDLAYQLYATEGTAKLLAGYGIPSNIVRKGYEGGEHNVIKLIETKIFDLVINIMNRSRIMKSIQKDINERSDGFQIRRAAADHNIPLMTDLHAAQLLIQAIRKRKLNDLAVLPWSEYVEKKSTSSKS
jgi:carbamoyl-phosphate synthase large subunit